MTATTTGGRTRSRHDDETHDGVAQPHRRRDAAAPSGDEFERERVTSVDQWIDDDPVLSEASTDPPKPLTKEEVAAIEGRGRERREQWDRVHAALRNDAQSCARAMRSSPLLDTTEAWTEIVGRSLDDYRSGRSLMDHLGADRLIDPALTGMLLAIRRGLLEEIHSPSMADYVLIDMAVIANANAMRIQSIIGNTALIIESEMYGQPTLRAKWKKEYGARPEDIRGLAVEDYVVRLREMLLPLVEKFNHSARDAIEGMGRQRQMPSIAVERTVPWEIRLIPAERGCS
jgi:hypothetical protein